MKLPKSATIDNEVIERAMLSSKAPTIELPEQLYVEDTRNTPVRVGAWQTMLQVEFPEKAIEAYCYDVDVSPYTTEAERWSTFSALQDLVDSDVTNCASLREFCFLNADWSTAASIGNVIRLACP